MIRFNGTIAPATLMGINACLIEHGFSPVSGQVNDDGFELTEDVDNALPDEAKQLIAETFAPLPDSMREERAEAQRQALFAEYDKKVLQYQREIRLGLVGAEDRLAAWDAYAEALRAINDTEGWYRNPQWPPKPEV
jgi:hypothetical protein